MVRLAIIGGRDFDNYELMKKELLPFKDKIQVIISGGAGRHYPENREIPTKSADVLAERFADEFGIPKIIHEAEWGKYGKSAGFKRNLLIINDCDAVIAFWDGKSKGTKHSLDLANKSNKPSKIIYYNVNGKNIPGQESHPRSWIVR